MADFCYDCTAELFGDGKRNDFADEWGEDRDLWNVLCEGCGFIVVDKSGKKVNNEQRK